MAQIRHCYTSFFHKVVSGHHRANFISPAMLSLPGDSVVNDMLQHVQQVFQRGFGKRNIVHVVDWFVVLPRINQGEEVMLEAPFDENVIHSVLIKA